MPSLYQSTVPVFIRNLKGLSKLLAKGAAHTGVSNDQLLNSRLIADMENLIFQVRVATMVASNIAVHLGKQQPAVFEDNEKTLEDLQARIAKTIQILEAVPEASFPGDDDVISFDLAGHDLKETGKDYVLKLATPNFYFHFVTVYALLRKEGVQIGKRDYLQWWAGVDEV